MPKSGSAAPPARMARRPMRPVLDVVLFICSSLDWASSQARTRRGEVPPWRAVVRPRPLRRDGAAAALLRSQPGLDALRHGLGRDAVAVVQRGQRAGIEEL